MSWNSFIAKVAEDRARATVFGRPRALTGAAQHAYINYNKGIRALENAVHRALPAAIEKARAEKDASYIAYLEKQGYTVIKTVVQ